MWRALAKLRLMWLIQLINPIYGSFIIKAPLSYTVEKRASKLGQFTCTLMNLLWMQNERKHNYNIIKRDIGLFSTIFIGNFDRKCLEPPPYHSCTIRYWISHKLKCLLTCAVVVLGPTVDPFFFFWPYVKPKITSREFAVKWYLQNTDSLCLCNSCAIPHYL